MENWIKVKISDIGEVVGGATPSTKNEQFYNGDISWITPKDLSDFKGRFISRGERNITQQGLESCSTRLLPKNTILFSSRAPIGYVAIAKKSMCTNQGFKSVIPNENVDYMFLYYLLKYNKDRIEAMGSGTTFKEVSGSTMRNIEVVIPSSIVEQKKIANILDAIDSKIETNQRINSNLEQQMHSIFTNYISSLASSTPIRVEDVILTANTGADAIQKAPIVDYDTGIRCVRVGDMTNKRSYHEWGFAKVTDEVLKQYKLHKNDIIVTRTASLGLNCLISEELDAVYNNGLIRLSINSNIALPLFIYRQFQTGDFSNYISRIESETSVRPNMKINYLLAYEFILPSIEEQEKLICLLQPMIDQQNRLVSENKHLDDLRDTLLPKLMSGEIDLSNISI